MIQQLFESRYSFPTCYHLAGITAIAKIELFFCYFFIIASTFLSLKRKNEYQ